VKTATVAKSAKGWMKVMHWDAWGAMLVYTFCTIAFYLLGAAILGRTGLVPEGSEMIQTLSTMYEPVFGSFARSIFLTGAIAVLVFNILYCHCCTGKACASMPLKFLALQNLLKSRIKLG
jgi:TRAP-type mannitol/chloroaromatic compound transport system permease large subunit